MKHYYVKPLLEVCELDPQYVLAASGKGEDIPWGAPGMNQTRNPFDLRNPSGLDF